MDLQLTDKLALVTASSGGIGLEIATSLAREGARVIVNGRTEASVEAGVAKILTAVPHAKLERLAADNGTEAGTQSTITQFPEVDILVNNLGIYDVVSFFEESDDT